MKSRSWSDCCSPALAMLPGLASAEPNEDGATVQCGWEDLENLGLGDTIGGILVPWKKAYAEENALWVSEDIALFFGDTARLAGA